MWQEFFRELAGAQREVYAVDEWLGIEFADGFAAAWILPGDSFLGMPLPASPTRDDLETAAVEFRRIEQLRQQAIHVYRRHLEDEGCELVAERVGRLECRQGMMYWTAHLGLPLTLAARASEAPEEALKKWQAQGTFSLPFALPTSSKIKAYLAEPLRAAWNEFPADHSGEAWGWDTEDWDDEDEDEDEDSEGSIKQALTWLELCNVFPEGETGDAEDASAQRWLRAISGNHGRIGEAITQLGERLPNVSAHVDPMAPGVLFLRFSDRESDYKILTHSKALARRFRTPSPAAPDQRRTSKQVGDELAEEFLHLDQSRTRVLDALATAAAARQWSLDTGGAFCAAPVWHLGESTREVQVSLGDSLTELLRDGDEPEALRRLLADAPELLADCLAILSTDKVIQGAFTNLSRRRLEPLEAIKPFVLQELAAHDLPRWDAHAEQIIARQIAEKQESWIWDYSDRRFYSDDDDWISREQWLDLARPLAAQDYPHTGAVAMLLELDAPEGEEALYRLLPRMTMAHHEADDKMVGLIWKYRQQFPEIAETWLQCELTEDCYAEALADAGFPPAVRGRQWERSSKARSLELDMKKRFRSSAAGAASPDTQEGSDEDGEYGDGWGEWDWDEAVASLPVLRMLPAGRQQQWKAQLIEEVRTSRNTIMLDAWLTTAGEMGWDEVFVAAEEHPTLTARLLTIAPREDDFDEPGLLMRSSLLLTWSAHAPSPFLAQLIATAFDVDFMALAEEASRLDAESNPTITSDILKSTLGLYKNMDHTLQLHLAIAWKRCRAAM